MVKSPVGFRRQVGLNAISILAMSQDADAGLKGHYLLAGAELLLGTVTGDAPCRAGEALFA